MHSIATRGLTQAELSRLRARLRVTANDIAWIVFPPFALGSAGFFLGKAIVWVGGMLGRPVGSLPTIAAASLLGLVGLVGSVLFARGMASSRDLLKEAIRHGSLEEIQVQSHRIARVGEVDSEAPILVLDVGGNKVLFLMGQWMCDPTLFDPPGSVESFPTDCFTIRRLPDNGQVLGVHVAGRPLPPPRQATLEESGLTDRRMEEFKDSVLFDGSLSPLYDTGEDMTPGPSGRSR